ncbi:MAG: pyridoxal-phosphate dependent enzyme [Planctomycetes bacterium]|nr:pyridoxal-phosphate dependent enzyme [Planctomycetota bacterium]MBI3844059.1 pyridoxal-phosphate dependent enzyme [Planctomycetota bacterium]
MTLVGIGDVRAAAARIRDVAHRTPLVRSETLSRLAGCDLHLKLESFQRTGSFKFRGALNRMALLTDDERRRGVITVSAGNHAQALACAAARANVKCVVVMPEAAVRSKVDATRGYGAEVVLHGDVKQIFAKCHEIARERGLLFVHAFDEPAILAGAGTTGLEIMEDLPDVDVVVAGVGGGGLSGGVSVAVRALRPAARVIGVEPEGAPKMHRSFAEGHAVKLDRIDTIADGLAAPFAGELTFAHLRAHAEGVVLVTDAEIIAAMRLLLERCKLLAEPAGAAATAALLASKIPDVRGKRVVAILSGGNVDLQRLSTLLS